VITTRHPAGTLEEMMHRFAPILLALCVAVAVPTAASAIEFDDHFFDETLRVDFYQYGDKEDEFIAIDRLIRQGRWAGPVEHLVDPQPTGIYSARLVDPESGEVLFETGFDSYFGEYRVTQPASEGVDRVYHETVLVPFPRRPMTLILSSRPQDAPPLGLVELTVDPAALEIAVEGPRAGVTVIESHVSGDPHTSLDILFVGEGYTAAETAVFATDVRRFTELMLSQEPYATLKDRLNIRGVLLPSHDSGVDEPTKREWRSTAVGASFYSFGSPRYLLTESNRDLRDIAAAAPYDTIAIMVNHDRYGGGGLYNRFCTFTAHGPFAGYLLLHEFGHSFGGLADEYYTSSTAYEDFYPVGREPSAPNITALLDPDDLKWGDLVTEGAELPTPWDKRSYDEADRAYQAERRVLNEEIAEAARSGAGDDEIRKLQTAEDAHALERVASVDAFMEDSGQTGVVGAFEGGGYVSEGLYRPSIDCLMFTRGVKPFCAVCRRAVEARIRVYTGESIIGEE
jgi:hypothetical protein